MDSMSSCEYFAAWYVRDPGLHEPGAQLLDQGLRAATVRLDVVSGKIGKDLLKPVLLLVEDHTGLLCERMNGRFAETEIDPELERHVEPG